MRRGLAAIALAAAVPLWGAAAQDLQPYHAVYALSLDAAADNAGVASVEGRREIRLTVTCHSIDTDMTEWQKMTMATGQVAVRKSESTTSESIDGRRLTVRSRSTPDPRGNVDGEVRIDETGRGIAVFAKGASSHVDLPAGTLLPGTFARRVMSAMRAGEATVAAAVYHGWEAGPSSIRVTMGPAQQDAPAPDALLHGTWRDLTAESSIPTVQAGLLDITVRGRLYDNGVSNRFVEASGGMAIVATLERFEPLPAPGCD